MHKTMWLVAWVFVLSVGASDVRAQTRNWEDTWYGVVNVGVQAQSRTFTEISRPVIYEENASLTVPHEVGGGPFIDLAGGLRVWRNLAVGLGYSYFRDVDTATLSGEVPNPLAQDRPRAASASTGELSHSESAIHLQLLWMIPVSDRIDVAAIVGPSFYSIKQDVVSDLSLAEGPPPFDSVTITSVRTGTESKHTTGFTAGLDGTYLVTQRLGAGAFIRFSVASVDLPTAGGGTTNVDAGGFQFGIGLRVRF